MNRDELLDKLAIELVEWPIDMGQCKDFPTWGWSNVDYYPILVSDNGKLQITPDHWLDRRTELINEPDDADAPDDCCWMAQDSDGEWVWHPTKPHITSGPMGDEWYGSHLSYHHNHACYGKIPAGHDWRTTLREVKREHCTEWETCHDNSPCGQNDQYCNDCPNTPHAQDARRLDAQLAADMRASVCSPEEDEEFDRIMQAQAAKEVSKHYRHSYKGVKLDPYRIASVYEMNGGPREQILKKVLRFTDKGHSEQQVVNEIRSALDRWQQMLDEDADS